MDHRQYRPGFGRGGRGGAPLKGNRGPTGVNNDPNRQPDEKLRALNSQPSTPGPRDQVFCTKIGSTHPDEMYIIGGHMDGLGYAEAANDNGSGTVVSRTELVDHLYDQDFDRDSNLIEVYVRRLRDKVGRDRIQTRKGQGYVFVGEGR